MEKQSFSYKCKGKRKQTIVTDNPYKTFGEKLVKEVCDTPVEVEITRSEDASQCVKYLVKKRSGTVVILEQENTLTNVPEGELKDTYLTCVDPEKNAYKFYRLTPMGDTVKASYGRMGTEKGQQFGERCYMYPSRMFWIKLEEKLAKGYIDNSDLYLVDERRPEEETKIGQPINKSRKLDPVSSALFEMLKAFSKKAVESAGVKVPITQAILDRINKLIKLMRSTDDLEQFNKYVQEAIAVLQRPVGTGSKSVGVFSLLAENNEDFARIISRESDLLEAMTGVYYGHPVKKEEQKDFGEFGIKVFKATDDQRKMVISHLDGSLKNKVSEVYRVVPGMHQKRFDDYCKKNHISNIKKLWHGSRNENFLSIVIKGLLLNPDAVRTGAMFGKGIYFAPSSSKSFGYTSKGKWTGGKSSTQIMCLYDVAYGKPYDVYDHRSWMSSLTERDIRAKGCDSLHAHKDKGMLLADEIIVYNEAAACLQYLVVFNG